jgi:hypothetical protein
VYPPTSSLPLLAADLEAAGVGIEVSQVDNPSHPSEAILDVIDQVGQFREDAASEAAFLEDVVTAFEGGYHGTLEAAGSRVIALLPAAAAARQIPCRTGLPYWAKRVVEKL